MNFTTFWQKLEALEKTIAITSPTTKQVKTAYWGATPQAITDLPCVINALSEPDRVLGFGSRDQKLRINVQCLVAKATVEDARSSQIATAMWFAAKDKFDRDVTITNTVSFSTLKGTDPTVPVILTHAGQAYIGFSAILEIHDFEAFTF
jgi:hypothetical protein